ncbi:MAG: hypothetical protein KZQ81_14295 [Candidatus Thiodiazotropha sp. (ex Rostrolucina anterorostrata)]|nr:hypothetical protein [Candidatus Thiodiazotropha sp. (ex Rostrolucina anterorostrata)]
MLELQPGQLLECYNFELADPKGWKLSSGYERFNGMPKPSEASFSAFNTTYLSIGLAGDTATYPGGTALLLTDYSSSSTIVLYVITGSIPVAGDTLLIAGTPICTADSVYTSTSLSEIKGWTILAIDTARSLISVVPGDGSVLGVWSSFGKVYAFRNDGPVAKMYESSSTGWVEVVFPYQLPFSTGIGSGTDYPLPGETVTNGTATAIIIKLQVTSGTWAGSDAAGVLTISPPAGGSFSATDALTFSVSPDTSVATSSDSQIELLPDGQFEFDNYNFKGSTDTLCMYGVDGVNPAFEFDGTDFVQIYTGLNPDNPSHIFNNNSQMFVAKQSSWLVGALGDPFGTWDSVHGSDEWGMGDEITGAVVTPGGTAISFARNSISIIYGDSSGYTIKTYSPDYGAVAGSMQNAIMPVFLSDAGLSSLQSSERFGDFDTSMLDAPVKDFITQYKNLFLCSVLFRNKNEYRMYFEGGRCLRLKFKSGQIDGFSLDRYLLDVRGASASVRSDRFLASTTIEKDHVFFYADDGYVYQMDSGESFDGEAIDALITLPYNHMGYPRLKKRWYNVVLEIESNSSLAEIFVAPDYKMYSPSRSSYSPSIVTPHAAGGRWNLVAWNEFIWGDGSQDFFNKINLRSVSTGIGLSIYYSGRESSFNIKNLTYRFAMRGERR